MMRTAATLTALATAVLASSCDSAMRHTVDPNALGPYSSSVVDPGGLVFLAGKVGRERESFASEVHSAIDNVEAELAQHGLTLADLLSVNVFVTDIERYGDVNAIYAERFVAPYPARTFVGVAALPGGAAIEIQGIARR